MGNDFQLVQLLKDKGLTISTAESITGGMLASNIVKVAGASAVFKQGFVTYASETKVNTLGVSQELIEQRGVVSPDVAKEMAEKCAAISESDVAIATTGNAGPDVLEFKPVGRVYIAVTIHGNTTISEHTFSGERESIRRQTANAAFRECINRVSKM